MWQFPVKAELCAPGPVLAGLFLPSSGKERVGKNQRAETVHECYPCTCQQDTPQEQGCLPKGPQH